MGMRADRTTAISAGFLVILFVSELVWVGLMDTRRTPQPTCTLDSSDAWLERDDDHVNALVKFKISYLGSMKSKVRALALPLTGTSVRFDGVVCVFFDERYPWRGLGLREWIGLKDHLPVELRKVGIATSIVDADQLIDVMTSGRSTVVIPSGVLPDTIYSTEGGFISSWLAGGGVLVWLGEALGFYVGHRDGTVEELGSLGQVRLLGYELGVGALSYWDAVALDWTDFAKGLGVSYLHAWKGPALNVLEEHAGLPLGGIYKTAVGTEYSSISLLPSARGAGKVIIFGGGIGYPGAVLGEDLVARDIAKILWSGLPYTQVTGLRSSNARFGPPVNYKSYEVDPNTSIEDTLSISGLRITLDEQSYHEIALMVFSMSPQIELYLSSKRQLPFLPQ